MSQFHYNIGEQSGGLLFLRYKDNILITNPGENLDRVCENANSLHPNLKFRPQTEKSSMSFLDLEINVVFRPRNHKANRKGAGFLTQKKWTHIYY